MLQRSKNLVQYQIINIFDSKLEPLKKSYKIVITIILILISYGFIYFKVTSFIEDNKGLTNNNIRLFSNVWYLIFAILLMPINWFIESIKWKCLIRNVQIIPFKKAFIAVLSGITIGIFTPNRIGEIGGRLYYVNKEHRLYATYTTWVGSFAQFIITILFGTISLLYFLISNEYSLPKTLILASSVSLTLAIPLAIWLFFNLDILKRVLKFKVFKKLELHISKNSSLKKSLLANILLLSGIRFFIFSSQYYLLLYFYNIELNFLTSIIFISLVYLFTTIIPTTTIAELGIRTSFAIFFIGLLSINTAGIIFSSFSLWIINLAIPAIVGSFFLLKNKF